MSAPHDRPTAAELVESVREWLERDVLAATNGRLQFHTRVAMNVLATFNMSLVVLFMLSTSLGKDLYRGVINPAATEDQLLKATRWASLGAGLLGTLFAIAIAAAIVSQGALGSLTFNGSLIAPKSP